MKVPVFTMVSLSPDPFSVTLTETESLPLGKYLFS